MSDFCEACGQVIPDLPTTNEKPSRPEQARLKWLDGPAVKAVREADSFPIRIAPLCTCRACVDRGEPHE